MPAIVIDTAAVQDAVESRLQTGLAATAVAFVPANEDPAPGLGAWARLVALDLTPDPRDTAENNPDAWGFVATVGVTVTRAKANSHAHAAAMEVVRRCFDSLVVTSLAEHTVEFHRAEPVADPDPHESRAERRGAVIVTGRATRTAGDSASAAYLA